MRFLLGGTRSLEGDERVGEDGEEELDEEEAAERRKQAEVRRSVRGGRLAAQVRS